MNLPHSIRIPIGYLQKEYYINGRTKTKINEIFSLNDISWNCRTVTYEFLK